MHYSKPEVVEELTKFLRGRKIFARGEGFREVSLKELKDLSDGAEVYGSAEEFNAGSATPSVTVLFSSEVIRLAIGAAKLIINYLKRYGVSKSVYVVWAGKYIEVRIHEGSLPKLYIDRVGDLRSAASLITETILSDLRHKLLKLVAISPGTLEVGNTLAVKQYLIALLSRLKEGGTVAYLKPEDLNELPDKVVNNLPVRHRKDWCEFTLGELTELASKTLKMIEEGVVSKDKLTVLSRSKKGVRPAIPRLVGRFEVMALLQAARYYALTSDLEKAKSFGLNRAIFYAWAKHYGRVIKPWRAQAGAKALGRSNVKITKVLGEEVPASESGWFIIGDKEQLPQDFDRQVVGKVSSVLPFEVAWNVTLQYIKEFPENILRNH